VSRGFEDRAADWIRFARAEGHDAYWAYRDAFFELLPPPPARALEVGCGEGRVTRDLRGRGYEVTGLDVAPTLVEAARDADPSGTYVVGDAAALPFDDASFDLVVSYNSLIDVDDMPAAVTEAGRRSSRTPAPSRAPGSRSKRCASHRSLASIATVGCACRSSCSGAR